ncbi:DUF2398 family protein [Kitasatospora sp. YST-16]|uniref:DUF2398 family protein n=1 Tax=Kitasatospora sp. YST-16 TaxID=2998080 RepID=UPI0022841003|nr:DUF2398 family protein [Kitasatospora sp. YST-16]WAL75269.1 DUF2398 family protein [Kitasatospora sp. YST-16]WNW41326.1 DUF2398 family protein [Streptomyces sp. Li-HN-5-13]
MERHEAAAGAAAAAGGTGTRRAGGAGRLATQARPGTPADGRPQTRSVRRPDGPSAAEPAAAAQELAARFAAAEPAEADLLASRVFGAYGARHLGGAPQQAEPAPGTSWWHGPTVHHSTSPLFRPLGYRRIRREAPAQAGTRPTGGGRHRKPERPAATGDPAATTELRTAARLLMAHPLVTADGPHGAALALIRRHAEPLAEHFHTLLGYRLTLGPAHARLHKAPLPGRPLAGLDPAGYAALARALAGGPAPAPVRALLDEWRLPAELAADLLTAPPLPAAGPQVAVRRLLAETPVVRYDDLAPAERAHLLAAAPAETERFADFLGLTAEIRAEGVALFDPADELTDLALPGPGTLAQAALLLAERLVEDLRPVAAENAPPAVLVPDALIDGTLGDITDDYGMSAGWDAGYLADLAAFRRDALDLLHRMGLAAPAGRTWLLLAPAARYAPRAEPEPPTGTGRHSRPATVPAAGRGRDRQVV